MNLFNSLGLTSVLIICELSIDWPRCPGQMLFRRGDVDQVRHSERYFRMHWVFKFKNVFGAWVYSWYRHANRVISCYFSCFSNSNREAEINSTFLILLFKLLIRDSYTGVVISGAMYIPRISMFICDQPEERTLLSFKWQDYYMVCTHCVLPGRI